MNITPERVTETLELGATREELAVIFSDAKRYDDNSGVKPELGKTAFDVANIPNNEAVDFCKQVLGGYEKSLDQIYNDPLKIVQVIGDSLQFFREGKIKENCK